MKYFSYAALALALSTGCTKDAESDTVLEGQYRTQSTQAPAPLRLYTSAGQVTDAQSIDRFLTRNNAKKYFYLGTAPVSVLPQLLTFAKTTVSIANLRPDGSISTTLAYNITAKTNSHLALEEKVQYSVWRGAANQVCDALSEQIKLVPSTYSGCRKVGTTAAGDDTNCDIHPVRVVQVSNNEPAATLLLWATKTSRAGNTCVTGFDEWNRFNPAVIKQLAAGDTIVVQENPIELIKQ